MTETEKLLLMAAAVLETHSASCNKVVGQALDWAGLFRDDVKKAWSDHFEYHPVIKEWYGALINMIQQPKQDALFGGEGNFGTPDDPIAMPFFTGCHLTIKGEAIAAQLLKDNPQYQKTRTNWVNVD